jgi:hypothetical protein
VFSGKAETWQERYFLSLNSFVRNRLISLGISRKGLSLLSSNSVGEDRDHSGAVGEEFSPWQVGGYLSLRVVSLVSEAMKS